MLTHSIDFHMLNSVPQEKAQGYLPLVFHSAIRLWTPLSQEGGSANLSGCKPESRSI